MNASSPRRVPPTPQCLSSPGGPPSCSSSDSDLAEVLARPPRPQRQISWLDLHCFNGPGSRDKRVAGAVYAKLGLNPFLLHGVTETGGCTCGNPQCGKDTGKHPVRKAWQRAPLDLRALDRALVQNPRFNIGLRMGMQPGGYRLIALDVDGCRDVLARHETEHGPLPRTLTAQTSRGFHLLYRVRAGVRIPNRKGVVPHLDVRSDRGLIVASPSRHASGIFYTWIDIREPAELLL